jgi:hypothetical protein
MLRAVPRCCCDVKVAALGCRQGDGASQRVFVGPKMVRNAPTGSRSGWYLCMVDGTARVGTVVLEEGWARNTALTCGFT